MRKVTKCVRGVIKFNERNGWREDEKVEVVLGKVGREERRRWDENGGDEEEEEEAHQQSLPPRPPPQTMRRLPSALQTAVRLSPSQPHKVPQKSTDPNRDFVLCHLGTSSPLRPRLQHIL